MLNNPELISRMYGTRIGRFNPPPFTDEILRQDLFKNVLCIQQKYLPKKETSIHRQLMLEKY